MSDFELIIIDDGSTDKTGNIIKAYAKMDDRIKYYHQPNQGVAKLADTINKGVDLAQSDLVARADADDLWIESKLEEQVKFMDSRPDYVIVGTGGEIIGDNGNYSWSFIKPMDDEDNRRTMNIYCVFFHPAVMFRKSALKKAGMYKNLHAAEDLDMWRRLAQVGKMYNIPRFLIQYRWTATGISSTNAKRQKGESEPVHDLIWKEMPPKFFGIIKTARKFKEYKQDPGVDRWTYKKLRWLWLSDTRRIAIKYIQRGEVIKGVAQLFVVCVMGVPDISKKIIKKTLAID